MTRPDVLDHRPVVLTPDRPVSSHVDSRARAALTANSVRLLSVDGLSAGRREVLTAIGVRCGSPRRVKARVGGPGGYVVELDGGDPHGLRVFCTCVAHTYHRVCWHVVSVYRAAVALGWDLGVSGVAC